MAAVMMGVKFMVPTVISVLALVVLAAAVQLQVRTVEEPYLRSVHGDQYLRFAGSAGFLPRFGRVAER